MAHEISTFAGYPKWQPEYESALLEFDREKLPERVIAAEAAIFKRLQTISGSRDHQAERQAIEDALARLRAIKNNLRLPDSKKK